MNVDLCLVFQFHGDCKLLVRNFLTRPPPFRKDSKIIFIAIVIDIALHRHRRLLERACTPKIARRIERTLRAANQLFESFLIFSSMPEVLKNSIWSHPSN